MATVNQLVRKPRARKVAKSNVPALGSMPAKTWRMYSCIYYHS
ncbi:30S ribosomal protein S12 [Salmonella enterica subsp. enterica]|nr:30S ribosomal protein S12 [Salmonella enterica subsp. enterica]